MAEIIIVCSGGCGRTTEGLVSGMPDYKIGEFEQVDESGVPKWTCPDCLRKRIKRGFSETMFINPERD